MKKLKRRELSLLLLQFRGGRLTILQEDQGQLLALAGEPDGKLRAAGH